MKVFASLKRRTVLQGVSLVLASTLALAGCGSGNGAGSSSGQSAPQKEGGSAPSETKQAPVKITMLNEYYAETAPKKTDKGIKELQEYTNTDLDITWAHTSVYKDKMNVTLASGELPQVIMAADLNDPSILNAARSGMFWDLGPYLGEFKNLTSFNPLVIQNAKIDGKQYAIPRPRPLVRTGLIIRKDWMDKLNIAVPTNADQIYAMLKAFAEKDPDGDGKNDTFGFLGYKSGSSVGFIDPMTAWFGAPNNWKVDGGKFIKAEQTPEYLAGLQFLRKLYREKLINSDFPVAANNEARKNLYNNKVGVSFEAIDSVIPFYLRNMPAGSKFEFTAAGPIGKPFAGAGLYGGALFPKSSVKTEQQLKQILHFFDQMRTPDLEQKFSKLLADNELAPKDQQVDMGGFRQIIVSDAVIYPPVTDDTHQMLVDRLKQYADAAIADPSFGLISQTALVKGSELSTILDDAKVKFILGNIDEAGFQAAVDNWRKNGGDAIAAEYAQLYKGK